MSWNANGLLNHQQELQAILDINKLDTCLISETHFTKQSFIKFRGYKVYHTIHPGNAARGENAIIFKENIYHNKEFKIEAKDNQAMALNIGTKKYDIVVASLYSPPKHNIQAESYVVLFRNMGNRFIIGGDFNAIHTHWGSRLKTAKGRELLKAINEYKCGAISRGKPTYWPTDTNKFRELMDFYIIGNISSNFIQIKDNFELISDHSPIILILSENIIQKPCNRVLVNKKTDWEGSRMTIDERIQLSVPIQTEEQLEF